MPPSPFVRHHANRVVVLVIALLAALSGIGVAFALRDYDKRGDEARADITQRAIAAAALTERFLNDKITLLRLLATDDAILAGDVARIDGQLTRIEPGRAGFTGGLGWLDSRGRLRAIAPGSPGQTLRITTPAGEPVDLSDREYVAAALRGDAFVSGGFTSRLDPDVTLIAVAVPTRDAAGRINGALAGTVRLDGPGNPVRMLDLADAPLRVLDRDGRLIIDRVLGGVLAPFGRPDLLPSIRGRERGALGPVDGLRSGDDRLVGFATVPTGEWVVLIDRSFAGVLSSARRTLTVELIILLGLALAGGVAAATVARGLRRALDDDSRSRTRIERLQRLGAAFAQAVDARSIGRAALTELAGAAGAAASAIVTVDPDRPPRLLAVDDPEVLITDESAAPLPPVQALLDDVRTEVSVRPLTGGDRPMSLIAIGFSAGESPGGTVLLAVEGTGALDAAERAHLVAMTRQLAQALERVRLVERQRDIAEQLQRSLLPTHLPELELASVAARYRPGEQGLRVGGDWYDVLTHSHGELTIAVGDIVGHGLAAAATMGRLRSAFGAIATITEGPVHTIARLDAFATTFDAARFSTVAVARVALASGELRFACAGHPPPLRITRAGTAEFLWDGRGPTLGVSPAQPVPEGVARLQPDDTLILYTDGLFERRAESVDVSLERLRATAQVCAPGSVDEVCDRLLESMLHDQDQSDDVALIALRLAPSSAPNFHRRLSASPAVLSPLRGELRSWLEGIGASAPATADVILAAGEAMENAVEHAYLESDGAGTIEVAGVRSNGGVQITIRDHGRWRDPPAAGNRGRGLGMMRALTDDVVVERDEDGTTVRIRRALL